MGSECHFVTATFADFLPGVIEKRYDFVVANVLRTAEREKMVDFTNRFWRSSSMFVGKPGSVKDISPSGLKARSSVSRRAPCRRNICLSDTPTVFPC